MEDFNKKEKNYMYLIYNVISLSIHRWLEKLSLFIESKLVIKYLENIAIGKICCYFE